MASKFPSTDLPKLKDTEDDTAVKKSILDLLDKINTVSDAQYPVGYVYTQYPGTSDPATLFGGTWLNITSLYAGLFFRAEGGSSLAFNAGNQTDAFQGHWHGIPTFGIIPAGGSQIPQSNGGGASGAIATGAVTDGTNGTPRTASETRPVNTTIRIWQRSGGTLTTTTGTSVTMGIYDSGTNSLGSWIRFTDGTMMQWGQFTSGLTTTALGVVFRALVNIPLALSFVNTTFSLEFSVNGNTISAWSGSYDTVTSSSVRGFVYSASAGTASMDVYWSASGKWK